MAMEANNNGKQCKSNCRVPKKAKDSKPLKIPCYAHQRAKKA